jgi:hypothetical protein
VTRKERAQVVELLRCAADLHVIDGQFGGLWSAGVHLEMSHSPLWNIAYAARRDAYNEIGGETYLESCLLAAQRVEDKEWP